jgi:hypothetical protein
MLIRNKTLLKDVSMLSGGQQTSSVEAFHSLILQFAPKKVAFTYNSMVARCGMKTYNYITRIF